MPASMKYLILLCLVTGLGCTKKPQPSLETIREYAKRNNLTWELIKVNDDGNYCLSVGNYSERFYQVECKETIDEAIEHMTDDIAEGRSIGHSGYTHIDGSQP